MFAQVASDWWLTVGWNDRGVPQAGEGVLDNAHHLIADIHKVNVLQTGFAPLLLVKSLNCS